ncbi:hypothetical protein [Campylobacter hyointestinalis]|uniref:hypothetical protein n=1 Tax=Campylobacter hyointestinalis TaxID=198 RepID=UPI000DCCFD8F|nr:hypothetical protein [Campylobacter hyointestinalis]RAZ53133.1 hypothetical protein CHL10074_09590 [Campylobacter hyointestinalis subsp. lawsonii]RAZ61808.1 hypothetical protein CHL9767_09580 [Campylobacter hyointestinalis subsp. lawsonii]
MFRTKRDSYVNKDGVELWGTAALLSEIKEKGLLQTLVEYQKRSIIINEIPTNNVAFRKKIS